MDMAKNRKLCAGSLDFFKALMPGFSKKLSLPRKFTNIIITGNRKRATIRSPLGKLWRIKFQGDIEGLHFGEGWREFARAHGLAVGFFLVFNHEGGMAFSVQIFDRSLCMKLYNSRSGRDPCYGTLTKDFNCQDYLAISQLDTKYLREVDARNDETLSKDFNCQDHLAISQVNTNYLRVVDARQDELEALGMKRLCAPRPSFKAIMKPSNLLRKKPYMNIPSEFRKANNMANNHQLILIDPEGREWSVMLYRSNRAQMGSGWEKFRTNNNLKVGDECTFELVYENNRAVMNVSIAKKCDKEI